MQSTESNPGKRPGRGLPGPAGGRDRFDGETARRILRRAAAEQQRLSNELADSYSLEELEEIGAEAGISPEALRAAVEAHDDDPATAAAVAPLQPGLTAVRKLMPGNWSMHLKGGALAAAGSIGFVALLLAFPALAEIILWALLALLIVLAVLIVLGAVPF